MIDFLFEHAPRTPALFETRVASWRVTGLSRVLDEYQVRVFSTAKQRRPIARCIIQTQS